MANEVEIQQDSTDSYSFLIPDDFKGVWEEFKALCRKSDRSAAGMIRAKIREMVESESVK